MTPLVVAHKDADHVADLDFLWQLSDMTPMVVTYNEIGHSNYLEFLHDSYGSGITDWDQRTLIGTMPTSEAILGIDFD